MADVDVAATTGATGATGEAITALISASVIIADFFRAAAALADLDAYF